LEPVDGGSGQQRAGEYDRPLVGVTVRCDHGSFIEVPFDHDLLEVGGGGDRVESSQREVVDD